MITRTRKEVFELWIEALRSGEYEQVQGSLREQDEDDESPKFCCLGVLCDLAVKDGGGDPDHWEDGYFFTDLFNSGDLPKVVLDFMGMAEEQQEKLIGMNDGNGGSTRPKTFKQIARYIEQSIMPKALAKE